MSDLVDDLRTSAMFWETGGVEKERTIEWKAADHIERLEASLRALSVSVREMRERQDRNDILNTWWEMRLVILEGILEEALPAPAGPAQRLFP